MYGRYTGALGSTYISSFLTRNFLGIESRIMRSCFFVCKKKERVAFPWSSTWCMMHGKKKKLFEKKWIVSVPRYHCNHDCKWICFPLQAVLLLEMLCSRQVWGAMTWLELTRVQIAYFKYLGEHFYLEGVCSLHWRWGLVEILRSGCLKLLIERSR